MLAVSLSHKECVFFDLKMFQGKFDVSGTSFVPLKLTINQHIVYCFLSVNIFFHASAVLGLRAFYPSPVSTQKLDSRQFR